MNLMPINPDFMPLLKGVRPFLGVKGQNLTDLTLNFVNLMFSQPGQETLKILGSTMNLKDQSVDGTSPIQYAFILFLILILLILGSNILVPYDKTSIGDHNNSSGEEEVIGEVIGEV